MAFQGFESNLLLITFDQLRGDWFDPTNPKIPIPAISGIASQGWTFQRTYTSSPNCIPARLSWATGFQGSQQGVTGPLEVDLPANATSMVRCLQKAGWPSAY